MNGSALYADLKRQYTRNQVIINSPFDPHILLYVSFFRGTQSYAWMKASFSHHSFWLHDKKLRLKVPTMSTVSFCLKYKTHCHIWVNVPNSGLSGPTQHHVQWGSEAEIWDHVGLNNAYVCAWIMEKPSTSMIHSSQRHILAVNIHSNSLNNGKGSPLIHWKWVINFYCPHYVTTEYGVTIEDAVEDNQLTQTIIIG